MNGQMTIFDLLYPDRINPIAEVAKMARPYWKDSREKIMRYQDIDIKAFAKVVRHQYCPYGCAGHYGGNHTPNSMQGYDMRSDVIKTWFYDSEGKQQERVYSWEDFAREIADLIRINQY